MRRIYTWNPDTQGYDLRIEKLSDSERAHMLNEAREKARRDQASEIKWAVKETTLKIAKNLLNDGKSVEFTVEVTGLTREDVEGLRQ